MSTIKDMLRIFADAAKVQERLASEAHSRRKHLVEMARPFWQAREEMARSYPLEWAEVVEEYRRQGVELDTLKLRGIVQYIGATHPARIHKIDPDGPVARLPRRTTDVAEVLRGDPSNTRAAELLERRGYRLDDSGEIVAVTDGKGRPPKLWRQIAQELAVFLRPHYQQVEAWKDGVRVPGRLVGHVHRLLVPYFPSASEDLVREAIKDLDG